MNHYIVRLVSRLCGNDDTEHNLRFSLLKFPSFDDNSSIRCHFNAARSDWSDWENQKISNVSNLFFAVDV